MRAYDHILSTCDLVEGKLIKSGDNDLMYPPRRRMLWHDHTTLGPELIPVRFSTTFRLR